MANHNAAVEAGLKIVPVLTKIDLPTADPEPALSALETAFGIAPVSRDTVLVAPCPQPTTKHFPTRLRDEFHFCLPSFQDDVLWTSAKSGAGINEVLPAVLARLPAPGSNARRNLPLRCLVFDSWFDEYRGEEGDLTV